MIHTEEYRINSHDCDLNGFVKPSAVLRYMHETANLQMKKYGPSNEQLRAENKAFILSKINLSFYRALHSHDIINVETWAVDSKGASFYRCSRVYRENDLIAEMVAVFALVDIKEKRLCRVSDVEFGFDSEPTMLELDLPARFKIPEETDLRLIGEYTVNYSDTDLNMHMNNTHYPDMICDFLSEMTDESSAYRVCSMALSYVKESRLGAVLTVERSELSDGKVPVRTLNENGETCLDAVIGLCK